MSDTAPNDFANKTGIIWRSAQWLGVAGLCALFLMAFLRLATAPLPSFEGKRVNVWFEESLSLDSASYPNSPSQKAFSALEGDAVRYLTGWVNGQPTRFDLGYAKFVSSLPAWAQTRSPKPRDNTFYRNRSDKALILLANIGMAQRFKSEAGEAISKPSIALAVPAMRAVLQRTNDTGQRWAAQAVWFTGSAAAAAIPELITLARDSNNHGAIQGLGMMGELASNAVPVLIGIALDDRNANRELAITALGEIGAAARDAVPALATLLGNTNDALCVGAARAIAETGTTPEEAVPTLLAMKQGTNDRLTLWATLALWNRDRQDASLRADLVAFLQTDKRVGLLASLGGLGTNAASLIPEIKPLVNDPDPSARFYAKRALRKIQLGKP